MKIYLSLFFVIFFISCDSVDKKFVLINNSKNTISYNISKDSMDKTIVSYYSDMYYHTSENTRIPIDYDFITSKSKKKCMIMGTWENFFNNQNPKGMVFIYFIDSLNIGKKDSLILKNSLIKKYKISYDELVKNNWEYEIE